MTNDGDRLAEWFEGQRNRLRGVAYRMLGSLSEAEDAVQETWLRLSRTGAGGIENLGAWLTTVVARVSLDMLRSRRSRREEPLGAQVAERAANQKSGIDPEQEVLLADSVGLALLVVLDTLDPAERLAFVLHDLFDLPFDQIAPIVGRSPAAARQLASRARRRVQGTPTVSSADLSGQRALVEAFLAAARSGDFEALVAALGPDVVLRADGARTSREVRGAHAVAGQALAFSARSRFSRAALVDGAVGIVVAPRGRLLVVLRLTFARGRIAEIDVISDPARLRRIDLAVLGD
jgi:RNA polymerase sigma factor (sigma-70 family)